MINEEKLGRKLALGSVQFGLNYGISNISGKVHESKVLEILNKAKKENINTIDTAILYGDSEAVLGRAGVRNFNVITKLNLGPALNVAGGTPWVRLNEINGELFLGGKIHGSNFGFNWTSFGQPNYISPEDDKLIIAKLSNDLSLKWFREIPGRYYVNQVFRPTPFGQDILFYGQNKSFVMDGNSVTMDGLHDIFIMTVSDLDSTTIEIKGNVFFAGNN